MDLRGPQLATRSTQVGVVHAEHHRCPSATRPARIDYYDAWNGFSDYWYWNAGLALAVDKLTFDFRYWGTDASNATSDTLTCINDYCDSRFVFSAKVVLP